MSLGLVCSLAILFVLWCGGMLLMYYLSFNYCYLHIIQFAASYYYFSLEKNIHSSQCPIKTIHHHCTCFSVCNSKYLLCYFYVCNSLLHIYHVLIILTMYWRHCIIPQIVNKRELKKKKNK